MKTKLYDIQKSFFSELTKNNSQSISAQGRMAVYQNGYRARIYNAITDDFSESIASHDATLVDELFEDFFSTSKSETYTLNAIGFVWIEFLNRTNICLAPKNMPSPWIDENISEISAFILCIKDPLCRLL